MPSFAKFLDLPDAPPDTAGRDHLRRLVSLRWWTVAGQMAAIAFADRVVGASLQLAPMFTTVGLLAVFNAIAAMRLRQAHPVSHREIFAQLCVDLSALSVLLFFSGGTDNPLASLYLPPIAFAAAILPARLAWTLALIGVAFYSALMVFRIPLTLADYMRANALHLFGLWFTYVASALAIAWFVVHMTAAIRRRDAELARAREEALRDERVVALGSLAAGAAHELGTPLNTLAILADEMIHDANISESHRDMLATMQGEIARCKASITTLAARAGELRPEGGQALPLDAWIATLIEDGRQGRDTRPRLTIESESPPTVLTDTTLEQALRSLLDNAEKASPGKVACTLSWSADQWQLRIEDEGPGFPREVIEAAGRDLISTRKGGHGLGLYLALSTIARHGGRIELGNRAQGGARVLIQLPLTAAT